MKAQTFIAQEREAQSGYFAKTAVNDVGFEGSSYRLMPGIKVLNLAPSIRARATEYFDRHHVTWHQHANHGLSSQVCCLNFLMPLADKPQLLAKLIAHILEIDEPEMLTINEDKGSFVGFEWVGQKSYLNETSASAKPTRGANATSVDAVVRFKHAGQIETLLIEWKYTEKYGAPTQSKGNPTRLSRYQDLTFYPNGPLRCTSDLSVSDFLWEPFYQLLRQQILGNYRVYVPRARC